MDRRDFVRAVGMGAGAYALGGCSVPGGGTGSTFGAAHAGGRKPNIIFIMVDDLGKEWISCCGGEGMKTPVIDELAAGGIRFENAYSMPQCTPTRACLLTGQYPWRSGWINHWDVPRWGAGCHFDWKHNPSFARVMKAAGYKTAAAGKWQINDFRVQPMAMEKHGFDEWCMWTGYESGNPPSGKRYRDPYINTRAGSRTYKGKFGPDVYTDFLLDFMKKNRADPMCLYFPMALTHGPFTTTPLEPNATGNDGKHKAMVRYVEHCVKRIIDALDELRIRDNTIVIFTTDNGSSRKLSARMNGRLVKGGKASDSENGICMPFIVNCPGLVPAGVVTDALTDFSDMLPTFAELGGASIKDGRVDGHVIDGKSIAKVILGKAKDSTREWIMAMGHGAAALKGGRVMPKQQHTNRSIRDKRFKLWVVGGKAARLHDLKADPGERKNLIGSTDPAAVAAREKLVAVWKTFPAKDPGPKYDPTPAQPWDRGSKKKRR